MNIITLKSLSNGFFLYSCNVLICWLFFSVQPKPCMNQANCTLIKGTTCIRSLCLCGDNSNPVNGRCKVQKNGKFFCLDNPFICVSEIFLQLSDCFLSAIDNRCGWLRNLRYNSLLYKTCGIWPMEMMVQTGFHLFRAWFVYDFLAGLRKFNFYTNALPHIFPARIPSVMMVLRSVTAQPLSTFTVCQKVVYTVESSSNLNFHRLDNFCFRT